jgi:hypothetical protein
VADSRRWRDCVDSSDSGRATTDEMGRAGRSDDCQAGATPPEAVVVVVLEVEPPSIWSEVQMRGRKKRQRSGGRTCLDWRSGVVRRRRRASQESGRVGVVVVVVRLGSRQ